VSFERVVNVPPRGIGDASVERLRAEARGSGRPLLEALADVRLRGELAPRPRAALEGFLALLARLRPALEGSAEAALEAIVAETRYDDFCGDLGDPGDTDRLENVRELVASAREYDLREPGGGPRGFLAEVSLVSDVDRLGEEADRVTLLTMHAAKGLEFPVVFLAGAEEGLVPHRRAVEERSGGDGLEEERRLFFVALTRARERVFLSHARSRTLFGTFGGAGGARSRFLDEIPAEVLEGSPPEDEFLAAAGLDDGIAAAAGAGAAAGERATLVPGERVRHAHFGLGRVVAVRGRGSDARAVVHFPGHGEKQLLLQYARLERVEAIP
jgi:DNA helicase-2/ATP-dependent DNA helicase PcrA